MNLLRGQGIGPGVVGVLAVAGFLSAPESLQDFPLDDAWIHLDYARGLVRDGSFTYNPRVPEAGFTSPLWVLIEAPVVALCDGLDLSPVLAAKALSLLFGLLGILALSRWVRALGGGPDAHGGLWLLAASSPWLVFASLSGMEATLFLALVAFAVEASWERPGWRSGVLWALAGLARPEAVMPALVAVSAALVRHSPGRVFRTVLPPVLAGLVWAVWCLGVTGHPLPNTFAVKAFSGGGVGDSLAHLLRVAVLGEGVGRVTVLSLLGVLGGLAALQRPRTRGTAVVFLLAMLGSLAAVLTLHPLSPSVRFFHARYLIPFLMPFLAFGALGVETLAHRLPFARGRRWFLAAGSVVTVAASIPGWLAQRTSYLGHCREVREVHTLPARALAHHVPSGGLVAVEAAGSARFHLPPDRGVLDLLGLNDHHIAWSGGDPEARSCYILGRQPAFLLIPDFWQPRLEPGFGQREMQRWETPVWTSGDGARTRRVVLLQATPRPDAWEFCSRRYGEEAH